jgi:peptidoglycan/xylan/chitin deacetylase (PgdA/CDA1 family)
LTLKSQNGRWPEGKLAAVSISFDHLGEASEIESGTLAENAPIGNHYTVTKVLPAILDVLAARGISGSFFLEAWNVDHYPDALRTILAAHHELGSHGFRHEGWPSLDEKKEDELLGAIRSAHARLGTPVTAFRTPGAGAPGRPGLTKNTLRLLKKHGFRYLSIPNADPGYADPPGGRARVHEGLAVVPYSWKAVDSTYYWPERAAMRGLANSGQGPDAFVKGYLEVVDETVEKGEAVALYCHLPYLWPEERIEAVARVADGVRRDPRVWLAQCGEIADWMLQRPEKFK